MYRFEIPGSLPGMNEIIALSKKGNRNYQPYSKVKRSETEAIAWIVKSAIKKKFNKVDIYITWVCKNKRKDKDNIMAGTKFILDGMVESGIIKNDGWGQIGDISHKFEVDKNKPRIIVELKEVKE